MKSIGIVGGLSWPSTIIYYRDICQTIRTLTQGRHTGRIVIDSWDFPPADHHMHSSNWGRLTNDLDASIGRLVGQGAGVIGLACNTLHRCLPSIQEPLQARVIHILAPLCDEIRARDIRFPLLVSTKSTTDSELYRDYIESQTSAEVSTLRGARLEAVHRTIFEELVNESLTKDGLRDLRDSVLSSLTARHDAIILGCTELCIAFNSDIFGIPLLNTTSLHARAIASAAIHGDDHASRTD